MVNLADDGDDPDGDGINNLLEYSQGMNPSSADSELAPQGRVIEEDDSIYRFFYRKDGDNLSYSIFTATDNLSDWSLSETPEQTDNNGQYWRDISLSDFPSFFIRLQVSDPTP